MPRPARHDAGTILEAALRVVSAAGPTGVTTEAVAREMGGHVGSIYYRFPTKDHLLAQLWMHCARAGHTGVIAALTLEDVDEALEAAVLHYPRWSRTDPAPARVLAAYSREHLAARWPAELDDDLAGVNDALVRALDDFSTRWWSDTARAHRQATTFAVLDLPAAAIRRYLVAGRPPPTTLDAPLLAAARGALTLLSATIIDEGTNRIGVQRDQRETIEVSRSAANSSRDPAARPRGAWSGGA